MQKVGETIRLSATDLSQFLACAHRTALDLTVALGRRTAPFRFDPMIDVLRERGLAHEQAYVDGLRSLGLGLADLNGTGGDQAVAATLEAMQRGVDVIVQASLRHGSWVGRPDLLQRVEVPSALGAWSYEATDTKLTRETKGGTILQLSLYSDLLAAAQGSVPEWFRVVTTNPTNPVETYRVQDFAAYHRLIRRSLVAAVAVDPDTLSAATYPEPVEHCDVCRWWTVCDRRRRDDDHLSFVAGIAKLQQDTLAGQNVTTLAALATLPLPLPFKPKRGSAETYVRIREQARLQLEARVGGRPVYELLPVSPGHGLARLPPPSPGDVFLDLEGDPYAREGGREYLFGLVQLRAEGTFTRRSFWAFTDGEERAAFEAVMDEIGRLWAAYPRMHVYHYAPYEPAAFKRLMGRHAAREAEIDAMLRAELFVDLYAVVRQGVRAGVERYSIKDLEPFYHFSRTVDLAEARANLRLIERALEAAAIEIVPEGVLAAVDGYNLDDCVSALQLRDWLESLRADVESGGTPVPRPGPPTIDPPKEQTDRDRALVAAAALLTVDVPTDPDARSDDQQARWLLAQLLGWHRREDKAAWWEFFRLRDLPDDELMDEKQAIAGLTLVGRVGGTVKSPIDRYSFPPQEGDLHSGDELHLPGDRGKFGKVEAIDRHARTLDVKKRGVVADEHPTAVFAHTFISGNAMADSLLRIAGGVTASGVAGAESPAADILLRRAPRLHSGPFQQWSGEDAVAFAVRVGLDLDRTVLAIQGPPGAGKTYAGARMICALVRAGKRVGVTATSHKVIRNLLDAVLEAASEEGLPMAAVHKTEPGDPGPVAETSNNAEVLNLMQGGAVNVAGGTQWMWARPDFAAVVDVLFVDEAGQMSLANVLAVTPSCTSMVLLGDPQQLEQPQQASHPDGAGVSALDHLLAGRRTIPADRGIFLPETWRLAPAISAFTSEVFYESRLASHAGLERQALVGVGALDGSGLWLAALDHDGNQNSSPEEADAVARIVARLLDGTAGWVNAKGERRVMIGADILVVAPYNAHVALISERLARHDVRVGTVDKFQGQEAPIVIYSMATSAPEDAPRGMEFLYSLNRLNVATSRARCACILVASRKLLAPDCKSPRQMQLANALCRYAELARVID
ncbi:MAG: TM0106 family RecB-like putative nuclease [Bauldia sp.]|nr:TM0106 family RecB-like putative nuclease [Bauldia sp.]